MPRFAGRNPLSADGIPRWQPGGADKERGDHEGLQAPGRQNSRAVAEAWVFVWLAGTFMSPISIRPGSWPGGILPGPRRPACAAFSGSAHRGSRSRKSG